MVLLAVGFFIGIVFENLISKSQGSSIQIFQEHNLTLYEQADIIAEKYLWYVLRIRMFMLLFLCIAGWLKWRKTFLICILGWTGFLSGMIATSAVIQQGIKGILLCLIGVFPQIVFYCVGYGIVFVYFYRYPEKQWNGAKTICVIVSIFLGIILESYVNPVLLKMVIKLI